MPVRITNYHDYTITVDGGDVRLKLARMTPVQFEAFNATFMAFSKGRGNPALLATTEGETEDQARARVAEEVAYLQRNAAWIGEQFKAYVRVVDGDLVRVADDGSDEVVTCGRRFAELYAGESAGVLAELWLRNGLSQKKRDRLPLLPDFATGSITGPSQAAPGPKPETVAMPAERANSAAPEDATALNSDTSCGTTDRSSSAPALSAT